MNVPINLREMSSLELVSIAKQCIDENNMRINTMKYNIIEIEE